MFHRTPYISPSLELFWHRCYSEGPPRCLNSLIIEFLISPLDPVTKEEQKNHDEVKKILDNNKLKIVENNNYAEHYAKTLNKWRTNFNSSLNEIKKHDWLRQRAGSKFEKLEINIIKQLMVLLFYIELNYVQYL